MLSKAMEAALNDQVKNELYSAYLYLAMAAWFEERNLSGFAHWMRLQNQEETLHAMKLFDYILERGGQVRLGEIDAPPSDWANSLEVFEFTMEHEQSVTTSINKLVDLAIKESDHASNAHLQWFVNEQVEEEASVDAVVKQLRLVGDAGHALFMIDRELSQRSAAGAAPSGGSAT
ncbi:MAG: ferritin [Candidatus Krumholzibacteriia bacterium]|nr:ferritin [bacterium]MCB9512991.1 ferritin [Candidatus Latescibacterota bacterium]MCB9516348.1 ferritin [Candidatus Latescibacterota bacterium]